MTESKNRPRHHRLLLPAVVVGLALLFYAALRFLVPGAGQASAAYSYSGTEVIAHRGGSGLWPENTLFAFQQADDLGVDALEMDVRSTADGVLVLLHDETVDRTTNGSGEVKNFTIDELKQLDAGYDWTADAGDSFPFRGQDITIPTLAEVFTTLPEVKMTIEIKETDFAVADAFCQEIRRYEMVDRVTAASIHAQVLRHFRSVCPEVSSTAAFPEVLVFFLLDRIGLAHLYSVPAEILAIPESWPISPLSIDITVADGHFIATSHGQGKRVRVWTVNDQVRMRRYLDLQADGIITDYPGVLIEEIERNQ